MLLSTIEAIRTASFVRTRPRGQYTDVKKTLKVGPDPLHRYTETGSLSSLIDTDERRTLLRQLLVQICSTKPHPLYRARCIADVVSCFATDHRTLKKQFVLDVDLWDREMGGADER